MSFNQWLEGICSPYYRDKWSKSQSNVICKGNLVTIVYMIFYSGISCLIDFRAGMWIQSALIVLFSFAFLLLKYKVSLDLIGNYIPAIGFAGVFSLCFYSGGLNSPVLPWISLVPIVSLLFSKQKWAIGWLIFILITILFFKFYISSLTPKPVGYNTRYYDFFYLSSLLGLISTYFFLNLIYKRSLNQANQELETKNNEIVVKNQILEEQSIKIMTQMNQITLEKSRSDDLLKNILPEDIAESLKINGKTEARLYENVSILFTDFVGFTKYCEIISPETLIKILHNYFQAFDAIIEKYGLEKIKTIGDAYMAVSGLPKANPLHAQHAVMAALEIRDFVDCKGSQDEPGTEDKNFPSFKVRLGIHSGTVIAGIIGTKKFAYDIWGDAVNTAARIQQIGLPQQIGISDTTYALVKDQFSCLYQGKIAAKNKGELNLYTIQ